ncbi:transporter substrate-binding domain-containing protein [Massilia sp. MB5]|uniref:substrate-binding periplasmic protein n=1 Tax=unclassified Massilia TaxID=2609279 RepID=UPI000A537702|nr:MULTISPECIES: transporter substrate-binding domain-containing protein [unclassified Massilia]UMR29559.1 transporter substrate-binding domain-containing protein [Massilia sp. MB5]
MLGGGAAAADQVEVVVYADDAYPPYSYSLNGEARGVYPGILRKAFARMPAYKVQVLPVPWKRGLKMVEMGEAFALTPPYYRPDERPYMDYSAPIFNENVTLFCNDSVAPKGLPSRWPDDYLGLHIGRNTGYLIGGKEFDQALKQGKITLNEARGTEENLRKLLVGRLDCYMNDRHAIQNALARIRTEKAYQKTGNVVEATVISQEFGYLGFTRVDPVRYPFKSEFVRQFNVVLNEMKRSGELEQIAESELRR